MSHTFQVLLLFFVFAAGGPKQEHVDDDEYELCRVKSLNAATGKLELSFPDGFVRRNVDMSTVRFLPNSLTPSDEDAAATAAAAAAAAAAAESSPATTASPVAEPSPEPKSEEADADATAYAAEVGPQLPLPPTSEDRAADEEAKYAFILA